MGDFNDITREKIKEHQNWLQILDHSYKTLIIINNNWIWKNKLII